MAVVTATVNRTMLSTANSSAVMCGLWSVVVLLLAATVSAKSDTSLTAANKIVTAPFTACIDESDCSGLGNGYACFQEWRMDTKALDLIIYVDAFIQILKYLISIVTQDYCIMLRL